MKISELKTWRKEKNLTQKKLAERLEVDRVTVARWETGKRKIPNWLKFVVDKID